MVDARDIKVEFEENTGNLLFVHMKAQVGFALCNDTAMRTVAQTWLEFLAEIEKAEVNQNV